MNKLFYKLRGFFFVTACSFLLVGCSERETPKSKESFSSFLNGLFQDYVTSDSLSLHYTVEHPEKLQITKPEVTLGTFSAENLKESSSAAKQTLDLLQQFSKDSLSEQEQLLYDLLEYALQYSILPEGCELYDSPLGPSTGLQTQLPVLLAEYRFTKRSDIEDYFLLLEDLPRYFTDICNFEKKRSASGTQSCSEVLDRIRLQCETFIENPGSNFLIAGFPDRLSHVSDLTSTEIAELCIRNQSLIFSKVIPAYELLIETLKELRETAPSAKGLAAYPKGLAYYDYLVHSSTGTDKSLEELMVLLEDTLQNSLRTMTSLYGTDALANELNHYLENGLSSSNTATTSELPDTPIDKKEILSLSEILLSDLQNQIIRDFPSPAVASCKVETIHPSLEDFISPALYLVPPLDGYSQNVIYINRSKCSPETMFSTLAHEGYPGHLYQNTFFASTNPHPLRMVLNFTGYDEGWATYAECYAYRYADCSPKLQEFLIAEQVAGLCLYSLSDMRIHYLGESKDEIMAFLQKYGFSEETATEIYYSQLAEPAIYLPYTVGYLEFCELRDCYVQACGNDASLLPFHTLLLKTGPAPFGLLKDLISRLF